MGLRRLTAFAKARLSFQRPSDRAQLERVAAQRVYQIVPVEPVHHVLAAALAVNQACVLEYRQVARNRRRAHREALGQIGSGQISFREISEDLSPRSGRECFEDFVDLH